MRRVLGEKLSALTFGADCRGLRGGERTQTRQFGEVIFVLPLPLAVRLDDNVEGLISSVEAEPSSSQQLLQVDIPRAKVPISIPEDRERVCAVPVCYAEAVELAPGVLDMVPLAGPELLQVVDQVEIRPSTDGANRREDHDAIRRLLDEQLRQRPAHASAINASQQDGVAGAPCHGRQSSQPVGHGRAAITRSPSARMAAASAGVNTPSVCASAKSSSSFQRQLPSGSTITSSA